MSETEISWGWVCQRWKEEKKNTDEKEEEEEKQGSVDAEKRRMGVSGNLMWLLPR
jgi:hypothetical protein